MEPLWLCEMEECKNRIQCGYCDPGIPRKFSILAGIYFSWKNNASEIPVSVTFFDKTEYSSYKWWRDFQGDDIAVQNLQFDSESQRQGKRMHAMLQELDWINGIMFMVTSYIFPISTLTLNLWLEEFRPLKKISRILIFERCQTTMFRMLVQHGTNSQFQSTEIVWVKTESSPFNATCIYDVWICWRMSGSRETSDLKTKHHTCTNKRQSPCSKVGWAFCKTPEELPCRSSGCNETYRSDVVLARETCDSGNCYCNYPLPRGMCFGKSFLRPRFRTVQYRRNLKVKSCR